MIEGMKARVPSPTEPLVQQLMTTFQLSGTPVHLRYTDHGYDPDYCHLSAKHCAITKGGRRVHGWALWGFDGMLVSEHHSVWEDSNGNLVDVTPPKFGVDHILFVRDDASDLIEMNGVYAMWADRTTIPEVPFAFQGKPHNEPNWGLPPDSKSIKVFCEKFGLNPSDILKDDRFG